MRILVFSDTHGKINSAIKIIEGQKQVNLIVHLGDLVKDAQDIQAIFKDIRVEFVSGNNDIYDYVDNEKIISIGNKKLLITHGHKYKVKRSMDDLVKRGLELNVDAVLFGHTHKSYENIVNNILYFNPGSLTLPVIKPSYGLIEILNDKVNSMICNI